jgi:hypothetical protein
MLNTDESSISIDVNLRDDESVTKKSNGGGISNEQMEMLYPQT